MPNIQTANEQHLRYCERPGGGGLDKYLSRKVSTRHGMMSASVFVSIGDVRRCVHGKVMVAYEVLGVADCYWRDLHPIFTPFRYRAAVKALKESS